VTKSRDKEYLIAFGNHLRKLRKSKGLSMTQLADICDIEYRQVSDIELGKIGTGISTIKILAEALAVTPKDLLDF
jgi:transcriptional regulator with XRE-family HTH domain